MGDRVRSGQRGRRAQGRDAPAGGAPRRRGRRRAGSPAGLFFGAAAMLLVGVVVLAAFFYTGSRDREQFRSAVGSPAATGPTPSSYSDAPSTGEFAAIKDRASDGSPLTAEEAFPPSARRLTDADSHVRLDLEASHLESDCALAVWGARLGDVLRKGGCTQAARMMYADRRYAASVTVFNLARAEDADRFVDALRPEAGEGFVRPLTGVAALSRFGQGFSMARGLAMGHYAVISWVQRLDGGGDARDETLLSLLVAVGQPQAVLDRAAKPH
jgi:hypothetical protein